MVPAGEDPVRTSRAWRWWLLGVVCAIGLAIFMWAVGGCWNVNAPRPSGPATTPQEAVQKFMAAVDDHDTRRADSYCTAEFVGIGMPVPVKHGPVDEWIDRAGYLRFVDAEVLSETGTQMIMRVRYDLVTRFLDDEDPKGLNLAFVVFPERVTTLFRVVFAQADGGCWLVAEQGKTV